MPQVANKRASRLVFYSGFYSLIFFRLKVHVMNCPRLIQLCVSLQRRP